MSISQISSITRRATRTDDEPLNILTFPTHERYEQGLSKTNNNFYAYTSEGSKEWNTDYSPVPKNYHILDKKMGDNQLPLNVDLDLVLCHTYDQNLVIASQISDYLSVPLVILCHILPDIRMSPDQQTDTIRRCQSIQSDAHVFISDYSRRRWGRTGFDSHVIKHGLDTEFWCPKEGSEKEHHALSVVNYWASRDWCCGFNLWQRVIENIPYKVAGDNPGMSTAARSLEELRSFYRSCKVFVNTSIHSPVPTTLVEAMSCGCAVVSTKNCMIPEVIEHGKNGFMSNDEEELKKYINMLLEDESLRESMGREARKTIVESHNLDRFTEDWNSLFNKVVEEMS